MSRSSYSINNKIQSAPLGNLDPLLVIEKSLELNGQQWVENVNLIEDTLVQVIRKLGREYPQLKSTFVVRRLPNFVVIKDFKNYNSSLTVYSKISNFPISNQVPYTNANEYAIVLDKFDFSLIPYDAKAKSKVDKVGKPNFGQIEIFLARENSSDRPCQPVYTPTPSSTEHSENGENSSSVNPSSLSSEEKQETMEDCNVFLNQNKAYYSHEVFKAFATAFTKVIQSLKENSYHDEDDNAINSEQVQLVGPHLLKDLRCNSEVPKIFHLISQPSVRLASNLLEKCKVTVNQLKSYISITYEDTEVIIRPALFYEHGYRRVNANLTERIPLYHPGMLTVGESLLKGCLLFPTSYDTLWTLQFWPSEGHITCRYHPSSIILRLYKIFGAFCLNPLHFYETLNSNFLIGSLEDLDSFVSNEKDYKSKLLTMDYFVSSFLYELEEFSGVEDWAPRNFSTRLMHLLRSGIDAYDKGFHGHYFTKINVLRGLWRRGSDEVTPPGEFIDSDKEDSKSALKNLDDIRESPDNVEDYRDLNMPHFMETDDLEDEFGLKFDELDIHDDRRSPPKLTSDLVYSSVNPFAEETTPSRAPTASKGTTKSLSNFLKKLGGSRPSSEAGTVRGHKVDGSPPNTVRSMADVACEFEKSIALQRTRPSLFPFPISDEDPQGISSKLNLYSPEPGPSSSHQQYDNQAFEDGNHTGNGFGGQLESIYYVILQSMRELPPSDVAVEDPEMHQHMEKMKKSMQSQEELVLSWGKAMSEIPKPKFICPHAFTSRQIQYLAKVIYVVSRCSPSTIKIVRSTKLPSWEISGDILRIVLHQMRSECVANAKNNHVINSPNHINDKQKEPARRKSTSFLVNRTKSIIASRPGMFKSFKRDSLSTTNDPCKLYDHDSRFSPNGDPNGQLDPEEEMQLALEDPETAATNRLLQWLWQLRTSEIGRLSIRANRYLEELYDTSMVNSHFLEQHTEEKCFESLALRSAVAVTKIIETGKFPANIPLLTANKKGWMWAEMVLSLASWNHDKGFRMKAYVPVDNEEGSGLEYISKDIDGAACAVVDVKACVAPGGKAKNLPLEAEPDLEAVTLAFHSELATPIGWNDIEDPRQPGPYTVSILIFSSLGYYKLWEVIPGNLVHALVRLQKFNVWLQLCI